MKPLTDDQAAEMAELIEKVADGLAEIATSMKDYDEDSPKGRMYAVAVGIEEEGWFDPDEAKRVISFLRRLMKAHDEGEFTGDDPQAMGHRIAAEAMWTTLLDQSHASWSVEGNGNLVGVFDLGDIDLSEIDNAPDMTGSEAKFVLDGHTVTVTFEDTEWGDCEATATLNVNDDRLVALRALIDYLESE